MEIIDQSKIPYRTFADGTKIPGIGMGTFGSDRFTAEEISNAVAGAIKVGYRLFDGAAVYGNEDLIGDVYANAIAEGTVTREELCITTKVWNNMHGKGDVLLSCAQSLKDLKLDYIDVFFIHWPFANYHAPGCDGDARNPDSKPFSVDAFMATWRQAEKLVDMGLVKYIGMSSMTIPKLE
ncbi:MAG: aldo/keto reductase, partial [Eubacteriales bacterium]